MFRGWLHRKRSAPGGSRNGFLAAEALSLVSFRASPTHPGLFSLTICPHRLRCQWPGRIETFFSNCLDHRRERQRESTARIRAQREGDRSLAPWSWIKMERWIRMWLGAVVSLQLNIIGPRTSSQSWAERRNPTRWNFRPLGYYFDVFVCVFRVQSRVCVKSNIHLGTFAPINQQAPRFPLQPTDDDARSRIAHPSSCETALFIGSPYSSSYSVSSMGPGLGRIQFPATHHGPASLSPVEVRAVVTIHRQPLVHGTIRR